MSQPLLEHVAPPPPRRREPRGLRSQAGLAACERLMHELAEEDTLGEIVSEHLATGGKRLRARIALAATEALGGSRADAVPWAAACELLHNATLLHDDVQDGDRQRRGVEATWVRHGVAQAINAGDLCLMLPYLAVDRSPLSDGTRYRLTRALSIAAAQVARGQAAELKLLSRGEVTWQPYHRAVVGKTAALFSLPVHGAAIIAGRTEAEANQLAEAFSAIGLLFQLQDDVLDLYGDKGRGQPGSDIREGKVSALVVEHLSLHPNDRGWLLRVLNTPREQTQDHDVIDAINRFRDGGALAAVWRRLETIQDTLEDSPALRSCSRLHAAALDLVAAALSPIVHTHPALELHGERA